MMFRVQVLFSSRYRKSRRGIWISSVGSLFCLPKDKVQSGIGNAAWEVPSATNHHFG